MKRPLRLAGLCSLSLLVILVATNPQKMPSFMLIIPFVLVFMGLLLLFIVVLRAHRVSHGKALRFAIFGASLPTLLLVLQSLGQLTPRDLLTIFVLFCVSHLYMTRVVRDVNP